MKPLLIALLVLSSACNNTGETKVNTDSITITKNDSAHNEKDTISASTPKESVTNDSETNDSTIVVKFPKDSTWTTVVGKMKGVNHPVSVYIDVKQGKRLTAVISAEDSTANVRINQMITPDGKADGPFGKDFTFTIHQQGTYKLLIGENLMQGDEWKGNFKLTIRVK